MAIKDIMPWGGGRRRRSEPAMAEPAGAFGQLRRQMNELMEDFMSGFSLEPFAGGFHPRISVHEDDKNVYFEAELPGLTDKDIEVTLTKDSLTIRGEKKQEREDRSSNRYVSERSYGMFSRTIPLAAEVNEDKVDASFKNGVLNITLEKTAEAQKNMKKITIRSA